MIVFYLTDFILAQRLQENADTLELDCDGWSRGEWGVKLYPEVGPQAWMAVQSPVGEDVGPA